MADRFRRVVRRTLCKLGRHHPLRCAGAEDHTWTWDGSRRRWVATIRRHRRNGPAGRW